MLVEAHRIVVHRMDQDAANTDLLAGVDDSEDRLPQQGRTDVASLHVPPDCQTSDIVAGLASLDGDTGLVFKGGTALRLCHFEDYRYSADLDFSIVAGSTDDAYATIGKALAVCGGSIDGLRLTDHDPPKVAYTGPLRRERALKLDVAADELVLNIEARSLLRRWEDLPENISLSVYTLPEIAGEKLRCVLQRLQCRDLFDLFLLLTDGDVDILDAVEIFRPKAEHRGINAATFALRYAERLNQYRERWDAELQEHVRGGVPHFDRVERQESLG